MPRFFTTILSLLLSSQICLGYIGFCCTHVYFALFPSFSTIPKTNTNTAQATGVVVDDEVSSTFNLFKLQQGEKLRYYIYKIEDKKKIVIDTKGERSKTYEDFCEDLPENDCRYGLIDLDFKTEDGRPTSKLVLLTWNPDTAPVRAKMVYIGQQGGPQNGVARGGHPHQRHGRRRTRSGNQRAPDLPQVCVENAAVGSARLRVVSCGRTMEGLERM